MGSMSYVRKKMVVRFFDVTFIHFFLTMLENVENKTEIRKGFLSRASQRRACFTKNVI